MWNRLLLAVVACLVLAGCADPSPAATPLTSDVSVQYGMVQGRALDDERVPLANVTLSLTEASEQTVSAPDGRFSFPSVRMGTYTLAATHPLYEDVVQTVQVPAQGAASLDLTLIKRPEFRPDNDTVILDGSFDCGAEAPIITGPCWTLVEGTTCGAPINNCVYDPVFKSEYEFKFDVKPRWQTIIAELVWSSGTTTMDGMRLYVENTNVSAQGMHAAAVAKVHGNTQPLGVRIDRGVPAPGYETYDGVTPAFVPDDGGLQQIRVFPKGQGYGQTSQVCYEGQCLLGIGGGLNVRFTVYLTIFYNEAAPEGFGAAPAP